MPSATRQSSPTTKSHQNLKNLMRGRAGGGERDAALRAAEREEHDRALEPLEEDALDREREPVPVDAGLLLAAGRPRLRELAREDRLLVVERLVAARAQDRLAQPLQAEDE